jgi:sugar/nucleoside kinase (ribokinase family)
MVVKGLFVGLVTLDLIYQVEALPTSNQKIVAQDQTIAAGGPATNAAVAFQIMGGTTQLLAALGHHSVGQLIQADLAQQGVKLIDLQADNALPPPLSSIMVTEATGDRAVVSRNAVKHQAMPTDIPSDVLEDVSIVLIDGHQMAVGLAIAEQAKVKGIPIVVDGGSWKPGFEPVLALADYVIASANFWPPDCHTEEQVFAYLADLGIPHVAITHGPDPIQYWIADDKWGDRGALPVPLVKAVDTLGAGDIFHGAFCHLILHNSFKEALLAAADVAAHACKCFGTRQWIQALAPKD